MTVQTRLAGPAAPRGELVLEPPPELAEQAGPSIGRYLMYLPMLGGAGAMVFMYSGAGATPMTYAASGMYGLSSFGMILSQLGRDSGERRRKVDGERRDYLRYLAQARRRMREAARAQADAQFWNNPDPECLWSYALSSRRWERGAEDADFGRVRIALGPQRPALRLVAPETKPAEDLDPAGSGALRAFVAAHRLVPDLPVAVDLRRYARISLGGHPRVGRSLVRALIAQAAVFHAPRDLRIAVCPSPQTAADWEWIKWLPHALHPGLADGAGPVRLVDGDLSVLEDLFGADLAERPRFRPGQYPPGRAHLLVVLDGGRVPPGSQLALGDAAGVTVLDLPGALAPDAPLGAGGSPATLRLRVERDRVETLTTAQDGSEKLTEIGRPDRLAVTQAEALAHVLLPYSVSGGPSAAAVRPDEGFAELLRLGDPAELDPRVSWRPRAGRDRLRVPIGRTQEGLPVDLDIKESAQGGVGPHGLLIGATGSGKSELLRTLVLGLAATHAPDSLNFVLADFKGGATFLGLDGLPHVSAVITNLEEELPLVDRMQEALRGELNRRQELLRAAGNLSSVLDYERARAHGATGPDGRPLTPLPSLMIVVDEFSELLSQKPDFAELFVMIGRLGRSLAVHLLLASQRLEEGRLRGLETHLSYRLCLRTFSANESRMVLGVPDAHTLPTEPGNGYLKADVSSLTRFKAAYVSGLYRAPQPPEQAEAAARDRLFGYTAAPQPLPPAAESAPAEREPEGGGRSVLDLVVERLAGHGRPAHRVWLPPLDLPATLDALLGGVRLDPRLGLRAGDPRLTGALRAAVGELDLPYEQRRDPLVADLSGAAGNVAVIGGPQSGKSTLIRTLLCSLALGHTPRQLQCYLLDFGGGALATLEGLPHLGSLATRREPDLVRRTVAELTALLDVRERSFAEAGFDSMAAYRAARGYDEADADPFGDVLLVVDGWGVLRAEFEALEPAVIALATRGLAYGIHVVISANRWTELRGPLRDVLGTRFELKLGDPFESEVGRQLAANVPAGRPGRGAVAPGLQFMTALPRVDGKPDPATLADAVRDLVEAVRGAWTGPVARPVRMLPSVVDYEPFAAAVPIGAAGAGSPGSLIPLALAEDDLGPVSVDFEREQHFLVFGEEEAGKTATLRTLLRGITQRRSANEALFVLVDYRRTLLGALPSERLIGYASSAPAAQTAAEQILGALQARLPGPEVDPAALRSRAWWQGPELYLVVDDYDLVASPAGNPLLPLVDILAQSRDVGLHVLLARSAGGAGRALYEPFLQRLRELGTGGLLLSGSPDEGPLLGDLAPRRLPPGRALLHSRRQGPRLVQVAFSPAAE